MPFSLSCKNVNDFLLFQQVEHMNPQRTNLKHMEYYLCLKYNRSTLFLGLLDDRKFLETTFRCLKLK